MKQWKVLAGVVVAVGIGSVAMARTMPSAATIAQVNLEAGNDAHQAIAHVYDPIHAKTDFFAQTVVNGVTVYDVDVKTSDGEATAKVTKAGDYLEQAIPMPINTAPPGVQHIAQNLMKNASGVARVDRVIYFVNLQAGQGEYELQMDATGTIQEIRPLGQRMFETAGQMQEADAPNKQVITGKIATIVPGAQVTDVRIASALTHFYFARFDVGGGFGWAELNTNGQTIMVVRPDTEQKLPAPVMATVNRFFKSDKVTAVHSGVFRVFDLEESNGNDDIVLHIQADGTVIGASNYSQ
jgi:hypothetical protein